MGKGFCNFSTEILRVASEQWMRKAWEQVRVVIPIKYPNSLGPPELLNITQEHITYT